MSKKYFITEASNNQQKDLKKLNSLNRNTINFNDYQPKRLGIKQNEKIIVLEYTVPSTGKKYHHYIKLMKYHPGIDLSQSLRDSQLQDIIEKIMTDQHKYFTDKVKQEHIQQLLGKLINTYSGGNQNYNNQTGKLKSVGFQNQKNLAVQQNQQTSKLQAQSKPQQFEQKQNENQSKNTGLWNGQQKSTQEIKPAKQEDQLSQQINKGRSPSNQFPQKLAPFQELEKPKEEPQPQKLLPWQQKSLLPKKEEPAKQQQPSSLTSLSNLPPPIAKPQTSKSAWDDDGGWGGNNDDDWNFDDIEKPEKKQQSSFDTYGMDVDYNTLDLNKLSDAELRKHKQLMDKKYEKNFIKPGDPGFQYDKRIEFKAKTNLDDSWDEEEEE